MVSSLSSRLLACPGDSLSNSSRDHSRSGQYKRTFSGASKAGNGNTSKNETIISGYSADKEGPAAFPPVVSIDLHGRGDQSHFSRGATDCPKRRKRVETQFAASSAKADLARAGIEFKKMNKDIEKSDCFGGISVDLRSVRLIHSKDATGPFVTSNVSEKTSVTDYLALMRAVSGSYPPITQRMKHMNSFDSASGPQDASSSDQSTSSVSDTESDSGSDNMNNTSNHIMFIPPLVEDSLDQTTIQRRTPAESISPCNVISCASNAVTMTEMLQLSSSARLVTKSSAPFSVIHANAAFMRLSGKQGSEAVLGTPFLSLLESNSTGSSNISLTECMIASSMGNDLKLFLLPSITNDNEPSAEPVECHVRVSPIVARKTESREVTSVTHFAIELYQKESSICIDGANGSTISAMHAVSTSNLAVGVMG